MDIFGKIKAVGKAEETFRTGDGRNLNLYEVTISVPEARAGQANGTPYIEGRLITASLFLPVNMVCNLVEGTHIAASINISSKFVQEKNRYFPRLTLVRYVDLAQINWEW